MRLGIGGQTLMPPRAIFPALVNFTSSTFSKLMLADQAARVLAVRAGLAAETGGSTNKRLRERRRIEDLFAIEVRDRHFRGRDQVVLLLTGELEEVLFELRELGRCRASSRR